jgi:hypothetical protein
MQALRHNENKPDLHYLHTWYNALCEVAQVCQAGAKKYARGNYLKGQPISQLLACAERHIMKYGSYKYSDRDEETKRHHIAHAIWNLLQALENDLDPEAKAKWDDRLRIPEDGKEAQTVSKRSGSEGCPTTRCAEDTVQVRESSYIIPKEAVNLHPGFPASEPDYYRGKGAVCSCRSSKAFARKDTAS